ncbi:hypothetical protein KWH04_22400 [Xanthomonas campestris pv. trichodesmae]|uniref:Uncharacterized protein n=2 Tax=Xanthomonas citri TaxID=346 RepID=A0AB33CN07_XANCI|nr:hypothetical protein [Xanthomonas citri]ASK94013.1 hypothetical protein XcvCFBP7111P_23210 [Xanthomonas citri pv. vignicola]MBV6783317.1 hypothetical protein [Xanthomonas campestris pv. trichodesmae]MBZ3921920.1 hypothetical protein [Xanthomonas campestris pv. trichodesmae]MBZ3925834.1 hypothetical protein [Xanthomonas citri pv. sesbaniae]
MEKVVRFPKFSKALAGLSLTIAAWKLVTLIPFRIGFELRYLMSPSVLYSFAFDVVLAVGAVLLWRGRPASRWLFAAQATMTTIGWFSIGGLRCLPFIFMYLKGTDDPAAQAAIGYMARPFLIFGVWCLFGWLLALACFACFGTARSAAGRSSIAALAERPEDPTLAEIMRRRADGR